MERVSNIGEKHARLWHASLRLWIWRWQTLTPEQRSIFYSQQDFNYKTFQKNHDVPLHMLGRRHFDGTEEKIVGCNIASRSEWVQYRLPDRTTPSVPKQLLSKRKPFPRKA